MAEQQGPVWIADPGCKATPAYPKTAQSEDFWGFALACSLWRLGLMGHAQGL